MCRWSWTVVLAIACAPACGGSSATASESTLRAVLTMDNPSRGENRAVLTLTRPDGQSVDGATVDIAVTMVSHGHGSPITPEVHDHGNGSYVVDRLVFSMPGTWQLDVYAHSASGDGQATFRYDVP